MPRLGMIIDLQKCVGCGACAIACKTENNTDLRHDGQTFNWADFQFSMEGEFPNVKYTALPVLCNHCTDAACVAVCPVKDKAMFKTEDGITMHNDERCIGCRRCQKACPYSVNNIDEGNAQYSVISFNSKKSVPHEFFENKEELIAGCTISGAGLAKISGSNPPHKTDYKHTDYDPVRRKGVIEKCIFCAHRVKNGEDPYCVVSCPSRARVVGDLDDPNSEISMLLKKYESFVLKPEAG
ncbi:MAG: 4Fe-4S dicluster domain-containing protein, partial [Bacteroidetes bacterium]|nr:4Fe-4S dicluster domain-containing protein [Bacteroidota bacterium]